MRIGILRYLIMFILLGTFMMTSCRKCPKEKPRLYEYHLGLFDSLTSEGTQAVFLSNTGKLDTLVYGNIGKDDTWKTIGEDLDKACNDTQTKIIYVEEQRIRFKHSLGLDTLGFFRSTGVGRSDSEKHSFRYSIRIEENSLDSTSGFNNGTTFLNYNDVVNFDVKKKNTNDYIGRFVISKSAGLLQVKYLDVENPSDSIFTFKNFIQ